jgi:hypothetical protein
VGLAVGYYFGTRAGREGYEQIEQWLDKVRGTDTYRDISDKIEQLYEDGRLGGDPLLDLRGADLDNADLDNADLDEPTA